MKDWKIIGLFILGSIVFGGIFIYSKDYKTALVGTSELLKFIFSLVTVIIALRIYDRFGLNKKLTERRSELIIELLIEIKQLRFGIYATHEGNILGTGLFPQKNMTKYFDHIDENFLSCRPLIYLGDKDERIKKIQLIENNPLLPKSIKQKLEFLTMQGGSRNLLKQYKGIAKIYFSNLGKENLKNEDNWFEEANSKETLKEYLFQFSELIIEMENWIKKHSNLIDELNI